MVLSYEQAAAKGYFQYVEMLKYEEHLKKALKALEASEDLERECLAVRKHKYLDDEGPISPIQETNDDDDGDNNCLGSDNPEDFDVRVVDNSSFIISSKIPNKRKSKARTKRVKSAGVVEVKKSAANKWTFVWFSLSEQSTSQEGGSGHFSETLLRSSWLKMLVWSQHWAVSQAASSEWL